jgi:hypothetical protein
MRTFLGERRVEAYRRTDWQSVLQPPRPRVGFHPPAALMRLILPQPGYWAEVGMNAGIWVGLRRRAWTATPAQVRTIYSFKTDRGRVIDDF